MMDSVAQYYSFKNRIINGAMVIDQRNAGASVTGNNSVYPVDRFVLEASQTSKLTMGQNLNSVTPPAGFSRYIGFQSSSAYAVLAGDYFSLKQIIEGFNWADMAYGTANAQTATLSFWVRSSLTGTFGGVCRGFDGVSVVRSYPFTYTISSANTWTYITVTIPGDTTASTAWTATQSTTNGFGFAVNFGLGAGATFSGTAGSWSTANFLSATGAVSVVGTNGATFYITGVQLEKGVTATSFDYRPYGTELVLCQRYFELIGDALTRTNVGIMATSSTTNGYLYFSWQTKKRATPTITFSNATQFRTLGYNQGAVCTLAVADLNTTSAGFTVTGTGYIVGYANLVQTTDSLYPTISISSEL
jgi:hypothetical protein